MQYLTKIIGEITSDTMDPDIFKGMEGTGRRRRQVETFTPILFSSLNFTDEQRDVCGEDHACLYDLAVSGSEEFAMATKRSDDEFNKQVSELSRCIIDKLMNFHYNIVIILCVLSPTYIHR